MPKHLRLLLIALLGAGSHGSLLAQADSVAYPYEVTAGMMASIYQSVFSFQGGYALDAAVGRPLDATWKWQIGMRLGMEPLRPEGYVRLLATAEVDSWRPTVGLEIGASRRARFDEGKKLLRETREATEGDISPFYVAVHTTPISFQIWKHWRISIVELQFGTHLTHVGRTLRAQIGLISVGATL